MEDDDITGILAEMLAAPQSQGTVTFFDRSDCPHCVCWLSDRTGLADQHGALIPYDGATMMGTCCGCGAGGI